MPAWKSPDVSSCKEDKSVLYVSPKLSDAEKHYSNIERELLAIAWALEKLNHYVYGKHTVIETDHKPLKDHQQFIATTSKAATQNHKIRHWRQVPSLEEKCFRWRMSYGRPSRFKLCHWYRHYKNITSITCKTERKLKDETLSHLKDIIHRRWPMHITECHSDLKEFWTYESLAIENGIVLKGHRIMMPPSLRPQPLRFIHQSTRGQGNVCWRPVWAVFWPKTSTVNSWVQHLSTVHNQTAKGTTATPKAYHRIPGRR